MACRSYSSDSRIEVFWRNAASKLACPTDATSSTVTDIRAEIRRGVAVTGVNAPAVSGASSPFATAAAGIELATP